MHVITHVCITDDGDVDNAAEVIVSAEQHLGLQHMVSNNVGVV